MRVSGLSVSWRDGAALSAIVAGVVLAIGSRSLGAWIFERSSLWLGFSSTVGVMLGGALLVVAGFAYLLGAKRSYRHPETVEVRAPEEVESVL